MTEFLQNQFSKDLIIWLAASFVVHFIAWACLVPFVGPVHAWKLIQKFYRWLSELMRPVAFAVGFSLAFLIPALFSVWVTGIAKFP